MKIRKGEYREGMPLGCSVKFRFVGMEYHEMILKLYELLDRDFVLPFSQRKTSAETMMKGVFSAGEYLGVFCHKDLVACGGYRLLNRWRAELHGIAVHPDFRGRGLGKEICLRIMDRLREKGIKVVEVGTWEGSIGLNIFRAIGFMEIERYPEPDKRPPGILTVRLMKRIQ